MEIRQITAQNQESLEDFYKGFEKLGEQNHFSGVGSHMLGLVRSLRVFDGPSVWAVTSHADLNFVTGDDYRLPILASVRSDGRVFYIEYRMAADDAPWPAAYVTGRTGDVNRACEMIVFGLGKSGALL